MTLQLASKYEARTEKRLFSLFWWCTLKAGLSATLCQTWRQKESQFISGMNILVVRLWCSKHNAG